MTNLKSCKEGLVFDNALNGLRSYWNGREFDGFPVESIAVTSNDCPVADIYDDYETVREYFDSSHICLQDILTL